MALSSQDVHDKQFKLVRNSTGYDMDEVDAFLDEVEAEIARLTDEVEAAQERLAAASAVPEAETTSAAAARILEMAQRTADEYMADARRKADAMVTRCREGRAQVGQEARGAARRPGGPRHRPAHVRVRDPLAADRLLPVPAGGPQRPG